jgi:hypothetical protein
MFQAIARRGAALPFWRVLAVSAALVLLSTAAVPAQGVSGKGPGTPATGEKKEDAREALPDARVIIERHITAVGLRQVQPSITSRHMKGGLSMAAAGINGTLDIYAARPNKWLLRLTLPGLGEMVMAFDGTRGWTLSPMTGPSLLEGRELEERRVDADFDADLKPDAHYSSMRTIERTEFDGRPCYKVGLVRKIGGEDSEFYDVKTGLRAGGIVTRETEMGRVTQTTIETDYKPFGKVILPSTIRVQMPGVEQVITLTSIEYDSVPPSTFDMPAEIKALAK